MSDRGWRSLPGTIKRASLAVAIEELGHDVSAAARGGGCDRAEAHLTRTPLTVDAAGLEALSREVERFLERVQKIEAASAARLAHRAHGEEQRAALVLMLFEPTAHGSPTVRPVAGGNKAAAGPQRK